MGAKEKLGWKLDFEIDALIEDMMNADSARPTAIKPTHAGSCLRSCTSMTTLAFLPYDLLYKYAQPIQGQCSLVSISRISDSDTELASRQLQLAMSPAVMYRSVRPAAHGYEIYPSHKKELTRILKQNGFSES